MQNVILLIIERLRSMLDNAPYDGICHVASNLRDEEKITDEQFFKIIDLLVKHLPQGTGYYNWYLSEEGTKSRITFMEKLMTKIGTPDA